MHNSRQGIPYIHRVLHDDVGKRLLLLWSSFRSDSDRKCFFVRSLFKRTSKRNQVAAAGGKDKEKSEAEKRKSEAERSYADHLLNNLFQKQIF